MDERQVRLLVVLSAATIAVALVYLLVPRNTADPAWDRQATVPVWRIDAEDVVALTVAQPGDKTLALVKQGDRWMLERPVAEPADPKRVEAALRRLAKIDLGVPIDGESADALGLGDPPMGRIEVRLQDGSSHSLDVGGVAPVGWQTYARTDGGELVAVSGHLDRDVLLDPWTFRNAAVFSFEPAEFDGLSLASPGGTLEVRRDAGDLFWLTATPAGAEPIHFGRASSADVENLVLTLLDLRLDTFLDNAAPDGIQDPAHQIAVRSRGGQTQVARFGAELPMGRLVQTARSSQGSILPERLAFLDMGPTDLADRYAFPLASSRIERIEVSLGGRATVLTPTVDGWRATGLDAQRADALYRAVRGASVDRGVAMPTDLSFRVEGRVKAHLGADAVRLVEIGQEIGGHRLARDVSGGPPYAVLAREITAIAGLLPQ